jgi:hypothetical protein
MNINEIIKKANKFASTSVKFDKQELLDVLNHYKKLQIVYVDSDENVLFL